MSAKNEFNKALKYLDFGKKEKGEECLKQSIKLAEDEGDMITLVGALCCYGDFLNLIGKKLEAKLVLQRVVSYKMDTDVLDYEINRAKELLREIEPNC